MLIIAGLGFGAGAVVPVYADAAEVARATDWLGHAVSTRDGKELGTVRDVAIDEHSGQIVYFVVSVGSFLIENNLIAVAPDALVRTNADDGRLLLDADADALKKAKRFASDSHWPTSPDVARGEGGATPTPAAVEPGEPAAAEPPTGTATIESRSKTAHLSASERTITEVAAPPTPPTSTKSAPKNDKPRPEPITKFDHLDKDGDGVLNRSEFAPVITPKDSYSKIDANANGVIDPPEFDSYEEAHAATN